MTDSEHPDVVAPNLVGPCSLIALGYGLLLLVRPMVATPTALLVLVAGFTWLAFVSRRARTSAGLARTVSITALVIVGSAAFGLLGFVSKIGFGGLCCVAAITWLPLGVSLLSGPEGRGSKATGLLACAGALLLTVAGLWTFFGSRAYRAGTAELTNLSLALVMAWAGLLAITLATALLVGNAVRK